MELCGGKELALIVRVAARAVVRDAEQQVPSGWRETERRNAAEAQPKVSSGVRRVYITPGWACLLGWPAGYQRLAATFLARSLI